MEATKQDVFEKVLDRLYAEKWDLEAQLAQEIKAKLEWRDSAFNEVKRAEYAEKALAELRYKLAELLDAGNK